MEDFNDVKAQWSRLMQIQSQHTALDYPTLPSARAIDEALSSRINIIPLTLSPHSPVDVVSHITTDIIPALSGQARSSRYYGFVTGGVLPVAQWADNVVSHMDQNVQVHLPNQSIATDVEDKALVMVADLLGLNKDEHKGRTFTTGATGSNILGLACGRESVLAVKGASVGELGLLEACVKTGVCEIQVLTSAGHSSLSKAASVVGLGRNSVKELRLSAHEPWRLDIDAVEAHLKRSNVASIIAISAGEVNTGRFAVTGIEEMSRLRALADEYGAWIHVDGAFGIFARVLRNVEQCSLVYKRTLGLELADSITVDGHKILNVPYDCGMFFTRSPDTLQSVFVNPNAAYLSSESSTIPSPLNVGLENSRRFRALPVYAAIMSEGHAGFQGLVMKMVQLARDVASWLQDSEGYDLLPNADMDEVFVIVLFRAKDAHLNESLVAAINSTRQMYVSGTMWQGEKAVRIAVSSWKVDVKRDFRVVTSILTAVAKGEPWDISQVES